ncbi:hypothetical protein PR048_017793 [Dryococelus australis]|uniref:DDE-1 domain-containing protein n=1 Tax=Dryococelus australis TaxID=614101 RepID=A0ABQ9HAH4_9NEOP|nr:hypothetical protein PR048_017793 [Dryococelus australis]
MKPFVVGKLAKPRAFHFHGVYTLPCKYTVNKKACVFQLLEHHFPFYAGELAVVKVFLGKDIIKWNVLDTILAIAVCWEKIKSQAIAACFCHAGFHAFPELVTNEDISSDDEGEALGEAAQVPRVTNILEAVDELSNF